LALGTVQAGGGVVRPAKTILLISFAVLVSCQSIGAAFSESDNANPKPSLVAEPSADSLSAKWTKENVDPTVGADYLTEVEKQVIIEINMLRTDPASYALNFLKPLRQYYRGRLLQRPGEIALETNEGVGALEECIKALTSAKAVRALSPKKGLALAARDQAKDQARTGATGHTGSDHSTASERMNRYGKWNLTAGENIDYGNGQARRIVISFLIDDGVPSRGHRKNLLDGSFNFIGVATGPHPTYGKMCVLDLAGEYK
jgi:uncharacterized protein YkwD